MNIIGNIIIGMLLIGALIAPVVIIGGMSVLYIFHASLFGYTPTGTDVALTWLAALTGVVFSK